MKPAIYYLALTSIIISTMFSACVSNKNISASKKEKDKSATTKKTTPVNKKVTVTKNTEVFVPLLPEAVENTFKSNYPSATELVWAKEIQASNTNEKLKEYKASFVLNDNKNWIVYSENGEVLESRTQILPEQLPQNIYNSIKNKYPDASIISATTYKNTKTNGSYTATIKPQHNSQEKIELILMDNGTFISEK